MADSNAQFPERIERPTSPAPWEKKETDEGARGEIRGAIGKLGGKPPE